MVALASWLPACTADESSGTKRSATGTTGADPGAAGAGKTGGNTGTSTTGAGGSTGATGTGATTGAGTTGGGTSGTTGITGGTTTGAGGSGGSGTGSGGTGNGGSSSGGAGPGAGAGGTGTSPDASRPPGLPPGAEKIIGIDFMQRVVGKWSGMNQSGPLGTTFPMVVDFAPSSVSFMYGKLTLDAQNNVVWGFNIETYSGKDVLAYRNGGFLGGAKRDTRLQLIEYDAAKAYYRFCAVKEQGFPVDGCNYIDARYTFSAPDKMLFVVTTQAGKPHVNWDATRIEKHVLPDPFPASITSQGQGETPWPPDAGL
jgi:hypothetical protein